MALWTPDLLGADLYSWYDASDAATVTSTGSGVSQWRDKSNHANHANQTDDSHRPVFDTNRISFSDFQALTLTGYPVALDVILLARVADTVAYHTVLTGTSEAGFPLLTDNSDVPVIGPYTAAGFGSSGLTWPRGTYAIIYASVTDLANCTYAKDGSALATSGLVGESNVAVVEIGRSGYGQAFGDLYEMIFVTYGATTDTKQKLEGYLAWKWGFQGNLPADHPYKNAAPTTGAALTADAGSYGITGTVATFARKTSALAASYTHTGTAAKFARKTPATAGSYTLTGTAASFLTAPAGGFTLVCEPGAYVLTGKDASFPGNEPIPPVQPSPDRGYAGAWSAPQRKKKRKRDEIEELIELIVTAPPRAPSSPPAPPSAPPPALIDHLPAIAAARLTPPQRTIVKRAIVTDDEDDDDEAIELLLNLLS